MAEQKSENWRVLEKHIAIIYIVTVPVYGIFFGWQLGFLLAFINALSHYVIDAFIWKLYKAIIKKKLARETEKDIMHLNYSSTTWKIMFQSRLDRYKKDKEWADDPLFYSFIGIDQALHMLFYLITFYIGIKIQWTIF